MKKERGTHFYVFRTTSNSKNIPDYDRTCGTERGAKACVIELSKRPATIAAFYTIDSLPTKHWY